MPPLEEEQIVVSDNDYSDVSGDNDYSDAGGDKDPHEVMIDPSSLSTFLYEDENLICG